VNPPKSIKIGPFTYKIHVDQARCDRASIEQNQNQVGECDTETGTILISPKLGPLQQAETVLHEVLHALNDMTGISEQVTSDTEEIIVRALSPALLDCLRRNPALVRYLTERTP
jgi:hypothetical protein